MTQLEAILARIEEIEGRCDAATEGPWKANHKIGNLSYITANKCAVASVSLFSWGEAIDGALETADFIASSRVDLPATVAALRLCLKLIEGLEGVCAREEAYDNYCQEHGGRVTSPIREIQSALLAGKNQALTQIAEALGAVTKEQGKDE